MHKPPLTGIAFYLLVLSMGIASFIDSLDFSIANVAIPSIAANFGVSVQEGTWIITLFAVSNAITIGLTGWLATRFGGVRVALVSLFLFTFFSACCGLSWDYNSLVIFRILQGASGGPLMSIPMSLMLANAPQDKKSLGAQILVLLIILAQVLGPFVGGWLTDTFGWRWIFFINLPFCIIALIMAAISLKGRETATIKIPLDTMGLILLAIGVGALQVFLDRGNDEDWFGSTKIIILALVCSISLSFFVPWNLYSKVRLVEVCYFRNLNFTITTILTALGFLCVGGTTIIVSLWLQTQMGYTATYAGLAIMPMGITPVLIAPLVSYMMATISLRLVVTFGFIIAAVSCFWFSGMTPQTTLSHLMWLRAFQGLSLPLCFLPLYQLCMLYIDDEEITKATGVFNFLKILLGGGGISTALYVTLWDRRAALHHSDLSGVLQPLRTPTLDAYKALNSVGIDDTSSAMFFEYSITNQSYVIAFNDVMWVSGWLLLLLIIPTWLCVEPSKKRLVATTE